jgi:hypothetical protein
MALTKSPYYGDHFQESLFKPRFPL